MALRFSRCGARAPEHTDLVDIALCLGCSAVCGILVTQPGIEPVSPALQNGFLTTGAPGKSQNIAFLRQNGKLQAQGASFVVQWLRLCTPNAGGPGSIPGQESKILHATWHGLNELINYISLF